jgi:general secretion pathway protein J
MFGARGFTLIEILIAIGIFAMVGIVSGQMLSRIIDASERSDARTQRLYEIQRTVQLMERDLLQLSNRAIRDEFGDPEAALIAGMAGGVEFTRLGWRNPLGRPRSEVQRMRYELVDGELRRVFWLVLDRAEETLPRVQPLLQDVQRMEITYLDQELNDYPVWPPGASDLQDGGRPELSAIELRLEVAPLGEITRLFEVQLVDASEFSLPGAASPNDDGEAQDENVTPPEGEGQ